MRSPEFTCLSRLSPARERDGQLVPAHATDGERGIEVKVRTLNGLTGPELKRIRVEGSGCRWFLSLLQGREPGRCFRD